MPNISVDHRRRMKNAYRLDVARHLAILALSGETITYGALSEKFGGSPRGWGDTLGGIAIRCHENGLPRLSVLVVNAVTGMPSPDAVLYEDLGMKTPGDIKEEQRRCYEYDWSKTPLVRTSA